MLARKNAFIDICKSAIDVLLPPRCLATGEIVDAQGMVNPAVWRQLQFIENPYCKTCGMPFHFEIANDALCANCMEREPVFDAARSAVIYNDASRKMILAFKYGDRLHAVKTFAPWMVRAGQELIEPGRYHHPGAPAQQTPARTAV